MTRTVTLGATLCAVFLLLGYLVSGSVPTIDRAIADTLGSQWQHGLGATADVLSVVLGPALPLLAVLALLGAAARAWRADHRALAGLLLRCTVLLALCRSVSLTKPIFERARPREYPDFSFPSGHVVSVASVAFTSAVLVAWLARAWLVRTIVAGVLAVVVIAVCRIVLDVHWLTDVVGATLGVSGVGLVCAAMLRLLPARAVRRRVEP